MSSFDFIVPKAFTGSIRLDKYATEQVPNMNRSKLKSGVSEILVNQKKAKLSSKIKAGDSISIVWENVVPEDIEPENIPLDIIYENDDVTVVNKAQGMVTHPAAGNWTGTLVHALLWHWKKNAVKNSESNRPGIVHRLDKETSGIIITARNRDAEEFLQKQFQTRRVQKEYIAIVVGRPPHRGGVIATQIIRDPGNRKRFKAVLNTTAGKYAKTIYYCIACFGNYSLMRYRLKTGRTHQIRVHSKFLGCPILGDSIYNQKKEDLFPQATLMLHSRFMKIFLPSNSKPSEFYAKVPERFKKVLEVLHKSYPKEVIKK